MIEQIPDGQVGILVPDLYTLPRHQLTGERIAAALGPWMNRFRIASVHSVNPSADEQLGLSELRQLNANVAKEKGYGIGVVDQGELCEVTPEQLKPFIATEDTTDPALTIELLRFRPEQAKRLAEEAHEIFDSPDFVLHTGPVMQLGEGVEGEFINITHSTGNDRHTTKSNARVKNFVGAVPDGAPIGLHVDNMHKLPRATRLNSLGRIGLVLPGGPRRLLVGSPDILTMSDAVFEAKESGSDITKEARIPSARDLHVYGAELGSIAVLAILMNPGEGYYASTELVPHDGSTEGISEASAIAFWHVMYELGSLESVFS